MPHASLYVQRVTDFGSRWSACRKRCKSSSGTGRAGQEGGCTCETREHGLSETCDCSRGTCGSKVTGKVNNKNRMSLLIGCSFIPYSLYFISPLCYFFAFFMSPVDVFLSVVPHPYFLSIFIYCCFFTHACLYSFSFPKYFLFCLSCPSLPYSLATFHAMEQCSRVVG